MTGRGEPGRLASRMHHMAAGTSRMAADAEESGWADLAAQLTDLAGQMTKTALKLEALAQAPAPHDPN